jgi:hypothetical protein
MTPCGECARNLIFVQTAQVERDHDREVIQTLQAKVKTLEAALRQAGVETDKKRGKR